MRSEFVTPDWKPLSFAGLPSFSRVSLILRGFSDIFSDTRLTRFGVRSGIRARGNLVSGFRPHYVLRRRRRLSRIRCLRRRRVVVGVGMNRHDAKRPELPPHPGDDAEAAAMFFPPHLQSPS